MVKTHYERLESVFLNKVVQGPGAVFTAREWNETVVVCPTPIRIDECVELDLLGWPVELSLFQFLLSANIADPRVVKGDGFVGLWQETTLASLHCAQVDLRKSLSNSVVDYLYRWRAGSPRANDGALI